MKKFYKLFFLSFLFTNGFSQNPTPSTYSQVYNFEPGDSLEYYFRVDDDNASHDYTEGYILYVITGSNQDSSSLNYQVNSVSSSHSSNPFHTLSCGSPPFSYSLNLKDSSILYALKDSDILCMGVYDSVYVNQDFNGSKQNEVYRMCFESGWGQKFVDSLGQVSRHAYHQNSGFGAGEQESLVYYHKANGTKWGTPYNFVVMGINDVIEESLDAQISPNPVKNTFQFHITESYNESATFKLFDALGRAVKQEIISSATTTLDRDNLSNGIYFWQLENEGKILERGKVVFE